ncbi:MAG: adenylate kinase [Oscillospiraceae bacterium]|nr:adenylate kinase [Oscillospiraceae bacterium]
MGVKLILLGAPGAGKGTQAAKLSELLDIPTISTGNILRQAIKDGTEVGLQVKALMDAGKFAPDDLIMQILSERLAQSDCQKGYILDGVPRTLAQAEALEKAGIVFDHVISLEVPDKDIEDRMGGRRVCPACGATYHIQTIPPKQEGICDSCGGALILRADDAPETVRSRLEVYHAQTEPLKEYYGKRGLLREVPGTGTIDGITAAVMEAMGK